MGVQLLNSSPSWVQQPITWYGCRTSAVERESQGWATLTVRSGCRTPLRMFSNGEVRTAVAGPRFNPPGGNCPLKRFSNGEVRTAVAGPRFKPPGGNCPLKRFSNGEVRTAVAGPNCHEVAPK